MARLQDHPWRIIRIFHKFNALSPPYFYKFSTRACFMSIFLPFSFILLPLNNSCFSFFLVLGVRVSSNEGPKVSWHPNFTHFLRHNFFQQHRIPCSILLSFLILLCVLMDRNQSFITEWLKENWGDILVSAPILKVWFRAALCHLHNNIDWQEKISPATDQINYGVAC